MLGLGADVSVQAVYDMEITPEDIPEEVVDADVDGERSPSRPRWESRPMVSTEDTFGARGSKMWNAVN